MSPPRRVTALDGDANRVTCQDGDVDFAFVSGDLALDLAGTLKWRRDPPEALLTTPADAARWAVEAGVLTEPPTLDEADLRRLRDLREAVYRLVRATLDGRAWRRADLDLVNAQADGPPPRFRLTRSGTTHRGGVDSVAWAVARAAAGLLAGGGPIRIRDCDRDRCTRIFVDRSP